MLNKATTCAIGVILVHLALTFLHGLAHGHLEIRLNVAQTIFVAAVITMAPLVAGYLIWKDKRRIGGALLAVSMAGAFAFGIFYHFIAPGADNVNHRFPVSLANWTRTFFQTAGGIAVLEVLGLICGLMLVLRSKRKSKESPIFH
jgi:hypothetical protein